jgi:hypothetical protein
MRPTALAPAPNHDREHDRVRGRRPGQRAGLHPQDLSHEQVAQASLPCTLLASSSTEPVAPSTNTDADHRLLDVGPDVFSVHVSSSAPASARGERRHLRRHPCGLEAHAVGEQHAAARRSARSRGR